MKQQHTLQPKLRFPEFEGDWSLKKIKDIAPLQRGFDLPSTELVLGKFPVVYSNGIQNYHNSFKVEGPGIVTGRSGTIGKIHYVEGKYWPHNTSLWVTDFNGNEPRFIYYFFLKLDFTKYNAGSTVPTLNRNDVHDLKRIIPSLPEQQKIADYLSTIDTKINLLEEKKEQLALYKKAIMQKLFSQEVRFKDENGNDFSEWKTFQLKDILIEHKEKNKGDKYSEVLSVAKMKGVINQIEHLGRSYSAEKIDHYKVINPFDIVYTKSPTSGFPFGIIKQNKLNRSGVLSPLYAVFKPKTIYLGMLLHDLFLSEVETFNYLVPLVQKGAKNTMNINNEDFLNGKKYLLPTSEEEQQKIANFLSAIDESIEKVNEQISQTQSFKKAMLQQLFV